MPRDEAAVEDRQNVELLRADRPILARLDDILGRLDGLERGEPAPQDA